jgi:DNA-binding response OmpR family regulator
MASILLIDDDLDLVALLAEFLRNEGNTVAVAYDGNTGLAAATSGAHSAVVLDLMLPDINGLDVLRQLRRKSTVPVLMLTARGDEADCVLALELGADDYVNKPCTPRTLLARIRALLRRAAQSEGPAPGRALRNGTLALWADRRRAELDGHALVLTSTEFNLLELLMRSVGQTVSRADLSVAGLGRPLATYDRSVDVHMVNLRRKLGLGPDGRPRIQTVLRQGYQLLSE